MNDLTEKEIDDYLGGLPINILNTLQDKTWSKRTSEIAVKYSLTEEQTNILKNLVLFVIIAVENPNTLQQSIEDELGISNLLAEQLVKDIDDRVFSYVLSQVTAENEKTPEIVAPKVVIPPVVIKEEPKIEVKEQEKPVVDVFVPKKEEVKVENQNIARMKEVHTDFDVVRSMSKDIEYLKNGQDPVMHTVMNGTPSEETVRKEEPKIEKKVEETFKEPEVAINKEIPEIRPDISPAIELEVKPQTNNVPHNLPGMEMEEDTKAPEIPKVNIDDLGDDKVFVGSEFMKLSEETKKPVVEEVKKPDSPKWGSNTNNSSIEQPTPQVKVEEKISVPRYTSDPYREPIE